MASQTNAGWTVLFPCVAADVTEGGGATAGQDPAQTVIKSLHAFRGPGESIQVQTH